MLLFDITYETKAGRYYSLAVQCGNLIEAAQLAENWLTAHTNDYRCITEAKEHIFA